MTDNEEFLTVPQTYSETCFADKEAFKTRVLDSIAQREAKRGRTFSWKRVILIGLPVLLIPVSAYAAKSFIWGGENVVFLSQNEGPLSQAANPSDPLDELHQPGQQTFDLSTSRTMVNFPIREPANITGWTRVLSEGIISPQDNYFENPTTHKQILVSVTQTPLKYVDIYSNDNGQRIAVTQEQDATATQTLTTLSQGKTPNGSGTLWGNNFQRIGGFGNDLAILITGNWKDTANPVSFTGDFENILVEHAESNNTVTDILVDGYGNVAPSVLESFATSYLQSTP